MSIETPCAIECGLQLVYQASNFFFDSMIDILIIMLTINHADHFSVTDSESACLSLSLCESLSLSPRHEKKTHTHRHA